MESETELRLSFTARDVRSCVEALLATGVAQSGPEGVTRRPPDKAWMGRGMVDCSPTDWAHAWDSDVTDFGLKWDHAGRGPYNIHSWWGRLDLDLPDTVKLQNTRYPFTPSSVLELLAPISFTVAASMTHKADWWTEHKRERNSFSHGHFAHGWMAAFSGEDGHARTGSRRWLDHGPWRLLRDEEHDVTLVQLYDLDADEENAWSQCKPAQDRLGLSLQGGMISRRARFEHVKPSSYDRATRTSIIVVNDREPGLHEIHDAAAIKLLQPYEGLQVDQVAFVFLQEDVARTWLRELWLRGLECRAIVGGREVVLTDGYEPPPHEPPDWVKRVREREGV